MQLTWLCGTVNILNKLHRQYFWKVTSVRNRTESEPIPQIRQKIFLSFAGNTVTFWSYLFYIHYYFFVLLGSMFMLGCWILWVKIHCFQMQLPILWLVLTNSQLSVYWRMAGQCNSMEVPPLPVDPLLLHKIRHSFAVQRPWIPFQYSQKFGLQRCQI